MEGRCVAPTCPACGADQRCIRGACYDMSCAVAPCAAGAICERGACTGDSCAGVTCPSGTACRAGTCVPVDCPSSSCPAGSVCENSACVDHRCDYVRCGERQQCEKGRCLDLPDNCDAGSCSCTLGAARPCYPYGAGLADPTLGRGECSAGTATCQSLPTGGSAYGACSGAQTPRPETCDGLDETCNGTSDEGCPSTFTFDAGVASRAFGRGDGGTAFTAACPAGQILRGIEITTSAGFGVYGLRLHCGTLEVPAFLPADGGGAALAVVPGAVLGPFGWTAPPSPSTFNYDCAGPLTAVSGQEGATQLAGLSFGCTLLSLQGSPGAFSVVRVSGGASSPQGTPSAGATAFAFGCPAPQLATELFGRQGAWIDQLGMRCATPTLLLK